MKKEHALPNGDRGKRASKDSAPVRGTFIINPDQKKESVKKRQDKQNPNINGTRKINHDSKTLKTVVAGRRLRESSAANEL